MGCHIWHLFPSKFPQFISSFYTLLLKYIVISQGGQLSIENDAMVKFYLKNVNFVLLSINLSPANSMFTPAILVENCVLYILGLDSELIYNNYSYNYTLFIAPGDILLIESTYYLKINILQNASRYRPARLDLNESGIIEKPLKRTSTAISF